jgi:hypothetical protein
VSAIKRELDPLEIERLYFRAIRTGLRAGLGQDAEDFASWIAIKWLEGKSHHQTLDQSVIDYRRQKYGSSRYKEPKARMNAIHISIEDAGL